MNRSSARGTNWVGRGLAFISFTAITLSILLLQSAAAAAAPEPGSQDPSQATATQAADNRQAGENIAKSAYSVFLPFTFSGGDGKPLPTDTPDPMTILPQTGWKLDYEDSQETIAENGRAANAFDGNPNTIWHTQYSGSVPGFPHEIQIDLGQLYDLDSFHYLPRQDGGMNGTIAGYEFYVSTDGVNWGSPVASGTFAANTTEKVVRFATVTGEFIRLKALSSINARPYASVAEFNVHGRKTHKTSTTPTPTSPAATATSTQAVPSATLTPTQAGPTATATQPAPTATRTSTQAGPTATRTSTQPAPTATRTPTQPAPTATRTPTQPAPTATRTPTQPAPTPTPGGGPRLPLKASATGRYLVDQNNTPFLIAGDSPHGLFGRNSLSDAQTYLAGAHANGINAIWVELFCSNYSSICPGYTTYDGIAPFSWDGNNPNTFDLSAPNETYFARIDAMLSLAAQYQIVVFLDPTETGGWMDIIRANGVTKAYNYGVYLGNRYKNDANIVWLQGNDFQTWSTQSDDALIQAVANGIHSVDPSHIQTVELDFPTSDSLEDMSWSSIISLNSAYSYYPEYDRMLAAYNRIVNGKPVPAYFIEGVYEYQGYMNGYSGPHELRAQEYWVMLSGACGQLYGNANLYPFPSGWQNTNWQTSPGITQFKIMNQFFQGYAWYSLVPDQNHSLVTAGYGTYSTNDVGNNSDYATGARTPDGRLAMVYLPTRRTITVNMAQFSGPVTARWFDPTNGTYQAVNGSPFNPSGSQQFTPPGNNSSGEGDWVLVLQVN